MTKGTATPVPKVVPLPALIFFLLKTRAMACVSFTTFTATRHTGAFFPAPGRKTKVLPILLVRRQIQHMQLPQPFFSQQMQASS
jgi:hypothetical protein